MKQTKFKSLKTGAFLNSPIKNAVYVNVLSDVRLFDLGHQILHGHAFLSKCNTDYNECQSSTILGAPLLYRYPMTSNSFAGIDEIDLMENEFTEIPLGDDKKYLRGFRDCMADGSLTARLHELSIQDSSEENGAKIDGFYDEMMESIKKINPFIADAIIDYDHDTKSTTWSDKVFPMLNLKVFTREDRKKRQDIIDIIMKYRIREMNLLYPGKAFYFGGFIDYVHLPINTDDTPDELYLHMIDKYRLFLIKVPVLPEIYTIGRNSGYGIAFSNYSTLPSFKLPFENMRKTKPVSVTSIASTIWLGHSAKWLPLVDSQQKETLTMESTDIPVEFDNAVIIFCDLNTYDNKGLDMRIYPQMVIELVAKYPQINFIFRNFATEDEMTKEQLESSLMPVKTHYISPYSRVAEVVFHSAIMDETLLNKND